MGVDNELDQHMQDLWKRYLPQQRSRLETVSRAIQALEADELNAELRRHAAAEAHNLAGSLGTFGLHTASEIAQRIEIILASNDALGSPEACELEAALARLHHEMKKRSMV